MDPKWGMDLKGVGRDGEFCQNTMHKILRELINKIVVIMDVLVVAQCGICLHLDVFSCETLLQVPAYL